MRGIAKKADASLLEKIQNGSVSINKAHEMIKAAEARKKAGVYETLMQSIPSGFKLKNVTHPFDSEKELLLLTDGTKTIEVYCPLSLQRLNISGYDVIKAVWLKFNSYDFTHCEFAKNDMKRLLDFLNTIAMHEKYVERLDNLVDPILKDLIPMIENTN